MDASIDFNTTIANLERAFTLKVRQTKEALSRAIESSKLLENRFADDFYEREIGRLKDAVKRWEARRYEASQGFLLAARQEIEDADFMHEFSGVIGQASAAGRIVYQETEENERVRKMVDELAQ